MRFPASPSLTWSAKSLSASTRLKHSKIVPPPVGTDVDGAAERFAHHRPGQHVARRALCHHTARPENHRPIHESPDFLDMVRIYMLTMIRICGVGEA